MLLPSKASASPSGSSWAVGEFRGRGSGGLWLLRGPAASPAPPPPLGSSGGERGAGGKGWALTVPNCPCGPAAACGAAASSSSWGRAGGGGVTAGVEGRQPPAQLPVPAALSPGWVGGALRFLGQRAPAPLAPASPLAAPPSAPRSLLSASLGSRSPRLPGSPRPLAVPESVGRPSARASTGVCAAPPRPPHPVPVAGGR